ncbi:triosephosphate isomerase [Aquimarina sp. EL_43]|uniref:triose-phosphate isomerase n=1 Tax=unclassified Aquimarina TaxID=2627091 RepID=UPI0018CA1993|nr:MULTISPECIES: triose-phosphate isomerase [unclassified Aquimarina]MBG6131024.1 triosephosphate isomerase [Aquimarina sp. EL_35]MBG6151483.1 triosephosphate isomerase [Aquimarina sp. EL_32]MBG6169414.1 triosephosphate isomerase [Aquimarina sp. EL_43]
MRKKIVAGNWKMNKNLAETKTLLSELTTKLKASSEAKIIVAPTFTNLYSATEVLKSSEITVAAQNMHEAENGAYTGEISADMLKNIGVETVILGHSERRAYFGETDQLLAHKVNTALQHEMTIIFCFGEELQDRKSDNHFSVVEQQLKNGLFHIDKADWKNVILAYEPVWAIGTGETASPEQAQEMHAFIRKTIANTYDQETADEVSILYGGSVKPNNAQEIFAKTDVDGGLIGGASLDAENFSAIVNAI